MRRLSRTLVSSRFSFALRTSWNRKKTRECHDADDGTGGNSAWQTSLTLACDSSPTPPNAPSLFQALGQLGWKLLLCDAKVVRLCWLWSNWCEVVVLKSKSMFAVGKLASEQLTRWTGTATLKQLSFEMYHGILDCTQICNLKSIATTYEMSWLWWQCRKQDTTEHAHRQHLFFSQQQTYASKGTIHNQPCHHTIHPRPNHNPHHWPCHCWWSPPWCTLS